MNDVPCVRAVNQHSPLRSARQNSTQADGVKKPHIRTVRPATTSVHVVRRGCNLGLCCMNRTWPAMIPTQLLVTA